MLCYCLWTAKDYFLIISKLHVLGMKYEFHFYLDLMFETVFVSFDELFVMCAETRFALHVKHSLFVVQF